MSILTMKVFDIRFVNTVCYPTRRNQEQIKILEVQIMDLQDDIGMLDGAHFRTIKRAETVAKSIDYDEISSHNWAKYSSMEAYDDLTKSIDDILIKRTEAIDNMNSIIGNPKQFETAKQLYKDIQEEYKTLVKRRDLADMIHYMVRHTAYGTKQAESIVHVVNKPGNEGLRNVMQRYAKRIADDHAKLARDFQTDLDDILKIAKVSLQDVNKETAFKTLEGYKEVADRVDRLRAVLGEEVLESPDEFYNVSQVYVNLVAELNKFKITKLDEWKTDVYEFTRIFERWFNKEYALNTTALSDRVNLAYKNKEFYANPKQPMLLN